MLYFLLFAIVAGVAIYLGNLFMSGNMSQLVRSLRWVLGGGALAAAALLGLAGRVGIASILGMAGGAILSRGRLGPIDLNPSQPAEGQVSRVKSRFFEMQLDHDNGDISGHVIAGQFRGQDLYDLGQQETGALLAEVSHDSDSLSLLEAWLDANRKGWRDYFDGSAQSESGQENGPSERSRPMDDHQAREILGVGADATEEEIRAAHRRLLKAVHPDQGGSNYLAARINEAKDFLLRR